MSLFDDLVEWEKEDRLSWLWSDGEYEIVRNEITGQGRWSTYHEAIIKRDDEYVAAHYSQGSTEMQEDDEPAEFTRVEPFEKTVIDYRPIV